MRLSYEQERMYLFEALGAGATASNLAYIYWIAGDLDVTALTRAIGALHERHAILRTRYPSVSEQVVLPPEEFTLPCQDLRDAVDPAADVVRFVDTAVDVPFDLAAAPPVRWTLFVLGPDRYALTLFIHHIATDAWSRAIIVRELSALYRDAARRAGRGRCRTCRWRYADYAAGQRAGAEDVEYWVRHLEGRPERDGTARRPRARRGDRLPAARAAASRWGAR